jgi:hypothetical protein
MIRSVNGKDLQSAIGVLAYSDLTYTDGIAQP